MYFEGRVGLAFGEPILNTVVESINKQNGDRGIEHYTSVS